MVALRLVFGLLLLASVVCFGLSVYTGQLQWRRRGVVIVKATVVVALVFFAVLIAQRIGEL